MIKIKDLCKTYDLKETKVKAIDGTTLEFPEQGMFFIIGKSGCGKTTLLNVLCGLDKYDSGSIYVNGKEIGQLDNVELDIYRNREIGIIFQEYNLIAELTVYENIALASKIQKSEETKVLRNRIKEILGFVELEGYENRKISELSGGQKQRVAIARALIKSPKILFADEPTGNLDSKTSVNIIRLLKRISNQCLVIIVSHDSATAYEYGDGIIQIEDGRTQGVVTSK